MIDKTKVKRHKAIIKLHRKIVRKTCFKMGIPLQGLLHDLSKYSKEEMSIAKWYVGNRSPHAACRDTLGYSSSWPHHYHKNKHHWQYWLDIEDWPDKVYPIKMPYKYIVEMFCDLIGAGKAYSKEKWTTASPMEYYLNSCKGKRLMHPVSENLLVLLLTTIKDFPEEENFYKWYKIHKDDLKLKYKENYIWKIDYKN